MRLSKEEVASTFREAGDSSAGLAKRRVGSSGSHVVGLVLALPLSLCSLCVGHRRLGGRIPAEDLLEKTGG